MSNTEINRLADADGVARQAASDLALKLLSLLEGQPQVHLVLTGGTVGIKTLEQLAPLLADKDLTNLQLWWGDERFVEALSPERNFVQSRDALLSKLRIPVNNIHQMPSSDDGTLERVCADFASAIESLAPQFDVVLLGMGPDGHVASLFPNSHPEQFGFWVVAESDSPKEPAKRISMSYQALCSATEVWFLVAGSDKAAAVARVFSAGELPAARVSGREHTKWYLDEAAASGITS